MARSKIFPKVKWLAGAWPGFTESYLHEDVKKTNISFEMKPSEGYTLSLVLIMLPFRWYYGVMMLVDTTDLAISGNVLVTVKCDEEKHDCFQVGNCCA